MNSFIFYYAWDSSEGVCLCVILQHVDRFFYILDHTIQANNFFNDLTMCRKSNYVCNSQNKMKIIVFNVHRVRNESELNCYRSHVNGDQFRTQQVFFNTRTPLIFWFSHLVNFSQFVCVHISNRQLSIFLNDM